LSEIDPKLIVLQFNQCINDRDIHGLSALMSDDHVFIDSSEEIHKGKEMMVDGWTEFFNSYPNYRNHFSIVESRDNLVLMIGHSTCSYDPLDGPALWTAKVENGLVSEWSVYLDTLENRKMLNLPI
jgi:ketosteroid isomerase-like protein